MNEIDYLTGKGDVWIRPRSDVKVCPLLAASGFENKAVNATVCMKERCGRWDNLTNQCCDVSIVRTLESFLSEMRLRL